MTQQGSTEHVWSHIKEHRTALLTTLNGERLETRPMAPYPDESEGVIRFITKLDSSKAEDIGSSGPVNVGFSDDKKGTYMSIAGVGRLSQDRAKLKELWNPYAQAWLPQGPDAPDVALIVVEPDEAVLWDNTSSTIVSTFEHLRAAVTGTPPNVGTVEHVKL